GAYLRYMRRALSVTDEQKHLETRLAFSKIGVLMASAHRTAQALHPTNLHVNKDLYPLDTVQSKLPSPGWLEHWLDEQICFDKEWENRVSTRILHNMSLLMQEDFDTPQALSRYRRRLSKEFEAA